MRKVILMVALMVVSGSAMAEWVERSQSASAIFYYDPTSIAKDGEFITMSTLIDMKNRSLSMKSRFEYDCKKRMSRGLELYTYNAHMGVGNSDGADSHDTGEWKDAHPGELKIACEMK